MPIYNEEENLKLAIRRIEKSSIKPTDTSARKLFEHRKVYAREDSRTIQGPELLDIIDVRQMYGKVAPNRKIVYLSESKLMPVTSDNSSQPVYLVDFVATAFKHFRNYMRRAALAKRINIEKSELFKLQPARGWTSPHKIYHGMMQEIYVSFYNKHITKNKINENITDFASFTREFMNYLTVISAEFDVPFTFSGFVTSRSCPPHVSGLIVDLHSFDHNNDVFKNSLFLEDTHFNFFKDTAKKFGFVVDKNAPWRLIADLSSSAMKKYMFEEGVEYKNVFQNYFYKTSDNDLGIFKQYFQSFYNSLVSSRPYIRNTEYCTKQRKTISKIYERQAVSLETINKSYDSTYWMETYLVVRLGETNSNLSEESLDLVKKNIMRMNRKLDTASVMRYIDDVIQKNSSVIVKLFEQEDWQDFVYNPGLPPSLVIPPAVTLDTEPATEPATATEPVVAAAATGATTGTQVSSAATAAKVVAGTFDPY